MDLIDVAIPGHGSVGTKEDIRKLLNYLIEVQNLVNENVSSEGVEIPSPNKNWASPEVFQ